MTSKAGLTTPDEPDPTDSVQTSSPPDEADSTPAGEDTELTELRRTLPQYSEPDKRMARMTMAFNVFLAGCVIYGFARGSLPLCPIAALGLNAVMRWRIRTRGRDAVADRTGIRGPHLRHPIRWSDVAYLDEPLRYDPTIYLELANGQRKDTGFPASDFEQLARFADGVEIRRKSLYR